jgi:O-antigen/teichoic acid export membrane protein
VVGWLRAGREGGALWESAALKASATVKASAALGASAGLEIALPLVRMLLLSRLLSLSELGFASALATGYALYDQITDMALHRYVYAEKRAHLDAALAGAHGLLALRGLLLAAGALALAPLMAPLFGLAGGAGDFAALAGPLLIRGFEHLAPKVAERDYRFGPQMRAGLCGAGLSLFALAASLALGGGHDALIASLYGLALGQTAASHIFAGAPYRLSVSGPAFRKALHFGAPLIANGLGLAVAAQGDRVLVGALLGPEALGRYAVAMLAVVVPVTLVQRLMSALAGAAFYNARESQARGALPAKIRMIARVAPALGALYACGVLLCGNALIALVFGPRFTLPPPDLALLSASVLLRIARAEPFTSLLLLDGRTREAALGNLSAVAALLLSAALMLARPGIDSALVGRLSGEALALVVTFALARPLLGAATGEYLRALALACAAALAASVMTGAASAALCAAFAGGGLLLAFQRGPVSALRVEAPPGPST